MRYVLLLAALAAPTAALAQTAARTWRLTTWPGAAALAETFVDSEHETNVVRALTCTAGAKAVVVRRYYQGGEPRPAGTRSCGLRCQMDAAALDKPSPRRPAAVSESRADYRALRRSMQQEWETRTWTLSVAPAGAVQQLDTFAKACRIAHPRGLADAKWWNINTKWLSSPGPAVPAVLPLVVGSKIGPAALTAPLTPYIRSAPSVLHLVLDVGEGVVTVGVRRTRDGAPIAKDKVIRPEDRSDVYLRMPPSAEASEVTISGDGSVAPFKATVRQMEFVRQTDLNKDDAQDLALAGLE